MVPGAGIYLPGNATRALRDARPGRAVRPLGELIFRQLFLDAAGRELFEVDVAALWAGVGESRALSRADLHQVLLTGVGGEVRYDTAVRDLQIFDGSAKVEFGDGAIAEYDLVIGADGRRSTIRVKSGLGGPATPTGQIVYRSVVSGGPAVSDWTALLGRRSSFVVMPMGGRRLYCYADETAAPDVPSPADPLARVRELFGGFGGPVPAILDGDGKGAGRPDRRGGARRLVHAARCCWSATPPTPPRRPWPRAPRWRSRTPSCSARCCAPRPATSRQRLAAYEARRRPRCGQVRERTNERDRTRDVPPALRDPMLRRRGQRIFSDQYRELVEPM